MKYLLSVLLFSFSASVGNAQLHKMTWNIEGVTREALVYIPGSTNVPILFAFHGHGGTDSGFSRKGFEKYWPNAIVVYPQGLPTKSGADKYGVGTGWQHSVGEINNHTGIKDQDLKFFDSIVSTFSSKINPKLIFVHGWSNGGELTYNVLWTARGNELAAIAPASSTLRTTVGKRQIPVMQISGIQDPIVPFSRQDDDIPALIDLNGCLVTGELWATGDNGLIGTRYSSLNHNKVVFLKYTGGHNYPDNVPQLITIFFRGVAWNLINTK